MTRFSDVPASHRDMVDLADITDLDFDDEPTAVNLRQRRDSLFPPPHPDRGEVFSLIERNKRPGLVLVDDETIDFAEVMNARTDLPRLESPALDALPPAQPMPSISPVALPTEPPPAPPKSEVVEKRSSVPYLVTLGALAAATVAVALWTPGRTTTPQPTPATANVAVAAVDPAALEAGRVAEPRSIDLDEVLITASRTALRTCCPPPHARPRLARSKKPHSRETSRLLTSLLRRQAKRSGRRKLLREKCCPRWSRRLRHRRRSTATQPPRRCRSRPRKLRPAARSARLPQRRGCRSPSRRRGGLRPFRSTARTRARRPGAALHATSAR